MAEVHAPFAPPDTYAEMFDQYGIRTVAKPTYERPEHTDASDLELRDAISHVATSKKWWRQDLQYGELQRLFNLSSKTWHPTEKLQLHVQQTVRMDYPEIDYPRRKKFQGFHAGIMWIFLRRNNIRRSANAKKRAAGVRVRRRPKQCTTPIDIHKPPQLILL